jgi:hypothetical protein
MKKIIISILTITFLIALGCYKDDGTAKVRISLGNMPVAKNVQPRTFLDKVRSFFVRDAYAADPDIFIAAEKDNEILTTVSVNTAEITDSTVEMEVPAGDEITILVVNASAGIVQNYGTQKVNLEAGKTEDITIGLIPPAWSIDTGTCSNTIASWPKSDFITKYYIKDIDGFLLYEGYNNQIEVNFGSYYLYVEFIPFNVETTGFSFDVSGCK